MATPEEDVNRQHDDDHVTGEQWKWTVLAGMASYLDAGSIVALAAGLALWQEYLGMSSTTLGLLAALGPNAFGAAIFFMPNTAGKSLEEIEAERSGAPACEHVMA